jgi:hypothetical protein
MLNRYGAAYPTLIPRTMRTLLHALLDPSKVVRPRPCAPLFRVRVVVCAVDDIGSVSFGRVSFASPSSPSPQPFCTHFGALSAISCMSPHSTATLLLPHMLPYVDSHASSTPAAPFKPRSALFCAVAQTCPCITHQTVTPESGT